MDETGENAFDLFDKNRRLQIARWNHKLRYDAVVQPEGFGEPVNNAFVASRKFNRAQAHLDAKEVKTHVAATALMENSAAFVTSKVLGSVSEAAVNVVAAPAVTSLPEALALITGFNALVAPPLRRSARLQRGG